MTIRAYQIALVIILVATVADGKRPRKPVSRSVKANNYAAGVNAACDKTLEVLSDRRFTKRGNITWAELQREVCRRLNVERKEWFLERPK